jgi:DNA-binding MarR family transcriptional regulator
MQPTADLEAITDAVLTASRVLVNIASRSLSGLGDEVTLPQFRALVVLHSRGPLAAGVLADELQIAPSTLTRLCDRLASKGLIERQQVEGNRREVRLAVTGAGSRIVGAVSRRRRAELRKVVSSMGDAERRSLVRALEAFAVAAGEVPDDQWYLAWD